MDKELCEKFYASYYMQVFSYMMVLCGNRDLAEEITQETFFRVMKSDKETFRGESKVETWLCSIARNLYTDELQRHSRIAQMPEELPKQESFEIQLEDKRRNVWFIKLAKKSFLIRYFVNRNKKLHQKNINNTQGIHKPML